MNGGNIRLRMTLKINVGCLSLASEMNGGNIRLRMTLKINVGCLSLASEMNGGNMKACTCTFVNNLIFSENNGQGRKIVNKKKKRKFSAKIGKVGRSVICTLPTMHMTFKASIAQCTVTCLTM